eukprot:2730104-Karenia_brevis.AAC.1
MLLDYFEEALMGNTAFRGCQAYVSNHTNSPPEGNLTFLRVHDATTPELQALQAARETPPF